MTIEDPKRVVISGYDRCAPAYAAARAGDTSPELALLVERLPPDARVLDLGCGAGVPVTAAPAKVAGVTGVDISAAQIALARENVPVAELIHGDIHRAGLFRRHHVLEPIPDCLVRRTIEGAGLRNPSSRCRRHGYRGAAGLPPEHHPIVLARRG